MPPSRAIIRIAAYAWAAPNTAVGLLAAALALLPGGRIRVVDGVVEACGPAVAAVLRRAPIRGGAAAVTLGHVVLGRDPGALVRTRAHERVHVRQYERWGPLFLPAYAVASLLARLGGGQAYYGNRFEREAYRCADGPGEVDAADAEQR